MTGHTPCHPFENKSLLSKPHAGQQIVLLQKLMIHRRAKMEDDQPKEQPRAKSMTHAGQVIEEIRWVGLSIGEHSRQIRHLEQAQTTQCHANQK